jgi:hypothetical protein
MLEVQRYLQSNTIASLEQFGVFAKFHATKPYVILDYDMVESSKFKDHPIVCECRGLVLHTEDYTIVQKSFNRFFNLNEIDDSTFDWSNFSANTKEDGSLIKLRYYADEFLVTTRNSFADSLVGESGLTWDELVCSCLHEMQYRIIESNHQYTFIFELCTPHNMIVVNHPEPKLVLLGMVADTGNELDLYELDKFMVLPFERPQEFKFKSLDEVIAYLDTLEEEKSSTEGVVLKDSKGERLKAKSKWYLKLHRLSGNGNVSLLKNVVPLILQGEKDEVLCYFPHLRSRFEEVEGILNSLFLGLYSIWNQCHHIEDQKEFALKITKEFPSPFNSILFRMKKNRDILDVKKLYHEWNQSEALILKVLKG